MQIMRTLKKTSPQNQTVQAFNSTFDSDTPLTPPIVQLGVKGISKRINEQNKNIFTGAKGMDLSPIVQWMSYV